MFSPDTPGGRLRRRIAIGAALSVATAATLGAAAAGVYAHMNTGVVPAGPVSLQWPQPLPPPSATMPAVRWEFPPNDDMAYTPADLAKDV